MKFLVTFKSPDALHYAILDLKEQYLDNDPDDLSDEVYDFSSRWMQGGEYITVEFDTEANTATVVERK